MGINHNIMWAMPGDKGEGGFEYCRECRLIKVARVGHLMTDRAKRLS